MADPMTNSMTKSTTNNKVYNKPNDKSSKTPTPSLIQKGATAAISEVASARVVPPRSVLTHLSLWLTSFPSR